MRKAKAEDLFGGRARFRVIEALAEANRGLTAYQIAIAKGLDPAATYRCLAEFSSFGIVESKPTGGNQTIYELSNESGKAAAAFLRAITEKTSESKGIEEWLSPRMQAKRMKKIVQMDRSKIRAAPSRRATWSTTIKELMSKRTPGELAALVASSKKAFSALLDEQTDDVFTLKM